MTRAPGTPWPTKLLSKLLMLEIMPMSVAVASESEALARGELLKAEAQLSVALSSSDVNQIARLWADDFVTTMADGIVVSRDKRLASLSAQAPDAGSKVTSSNDRVDIKSYGNWAIVLVTSSWRVDGKPMGDPYQATHVWAKRSSVWRLVAAHISPVKP